MEEENSPLTFLKKNALVIIPLCIGVILISIGLIQIFGQKEAKIEFEKGTPVAGAATKDTVQTKIKVDVEGEVVRPGVYSLESDARVQDAIVAAGGLASNADRNSLNLAQKIMDGQKIYVLAHGEAPNANTNSVSNTEASVTSENGAVSINSASGDALESLSGIGPVTAKKIIDNRPYGTLEELVSKKAVGSSTFEKIKNDITL